MASIRGSNTRPELLLRRALWRAGARGWRCHWRGPGGRIDIAFTRWRLAVFVDGSFWHGHPSKWQPDRWRGYWDEKIKRNLVRDAAQNAALRTEGWGVLRVWDFEVEQDAAAIASRVVDALDRRKTDGSARAIVGPPSDGARASIERQQFYG
jgi:DNA mismatch endonuclease (patch repair protein)